MSIADRSSATPHGFGKVLSLNFPVIVLIIAVASAGFLMLFSVAGGEMERWAWPQMVRFGIGIVGMIMIAMVPIRFWRLASPLAYLGALGLLILVEVMGTVGMGAQRWIDFGFILLQPSEVMKIALVMVLAAYYHALGTERVSRPIWVAIPLVLILIPTALVLKQPDLGTALLLVMGGGAVMFLAGVSLWYFGTAIVSGAGLVYLVLISQGTTWQLIKDYQFRRIFTFLDPSADPLGAGYHITQAKIAMGAGGFTGRGYMQGTQTRLNFLPEKHTDFIFTTLAEEFGFAGSMTILGLYTLITIFCMYSAISNRDRFGGLLTGGITVTFFLFFAINMGMVMGLMPVVGVPLPLVSYGGSAMLVLMVAFGLVQSAHVHRPRQVE